MSQPPALSADPKSILAARNRVHDVFSKPCFLDFSTLFFAQPKKPSIDRSEPCAAFGVCINWSMAVGGKALRSRITHKYAVAETRQTTHTSRSHVSLSLLKQSGERVSPTFSTR